MSDALARSFEANRPHMRAVALRMLGSPAEADDAVQDAWLRLSRTESATIENLRGWLTTVVARICLDMLRARRSRREEGEPRAHHLAGAADPEDQALLADSVGQALLVVLDALAPAERLAFVLHDMFDVPYTEIGAIVQRSPTAVRQLASRARRRVRGASVPDAGLRRRREIVDAFLAASRRGDFDALVDLLDPEATYTADPRAVALGSPDGLRGAREVAAVFAGRAQTAQSVIIDGAPGLVWARGGRVLVAWIFEIGEQRIKQVRMIADEDRLGRLNLIY